MNVDEQHRFEMLQEREVDDAYVREYYGIEGLAGNADLTADMAKYRETLPKPPVCGPGRFDRYVIEGFLQTRKLLPKKWEAARLGMKPAMLETVIARRLDLPTPLRKEYVFYGCLIDEELGDDLIRVLPGLRFRTFSHHESFCERLHDALRTSLGISEQDMRDAKLWCATDQALGAQGDYPRRYAQYFDCLTCQPLSTAHQVWLDFGKPLFLSPDRCSKLFYVRHEEQLAPYAAGRGEPEGLERYREALPVGGN